VTAFCLVFFSAHPGHDECTRADAVKTRNEDEDPGKPRPVRTDRRRPTTSVEAEESEPWLHLRKDNERDRHRHVC
jgi:hypothetical protein